MAALRVSTFDDGMTKQIDFKVRNEIRKSANAGVLVRELPFDDAYVRGMHAICNESPVRQGKPFWHYGKDLETVRKMNATFTDRSIFIGAFFKGNLKVLTLEILHRLFLENPEMRGFEGRPNLSVATTRADH